MVAYQVMIEGGELKVLQCRITLFPSTAKYCRLSSVTITGGRSAWRGNQTTTKINTQNVCECVCVWCKACDFNLIHCRG